MTQTMIGLDYEGVPCIKITKGDIDPGEEPDANVGSFLYNSKWTKDYKLAGIDLMPQMGADTFWPMGATLSNYTKYTERDAVFVNAFETSYFRNAHFPKLAYDLPLSELKAKRISNGRFVGAMVRESLTGYDDRGGNWSTSGRAFSGWAKDLTVFYNSTSNVLGDGTLVINGFAWPSGLLTEPRYHNLVVWNLPGDETAILDGTPQPPIDGATVIQIDKSGARVAKPGFDLNNISRPSQLAFDSANSPTKIIGAADVACPVGTSSYDIGVTIPENAVADVFFYQGSTIYFPGNPVTVSGDSVGLYGAEYWFDGSLIRFNNTYAACRARFIIYANSTEAPTSGDNDVLRQFDDGTQNVAQILRPGAADPPNFSDIVIDSRWPCIQILADGYMPVGTGELTHTIDFDGTGCFPIVKWMTVHGAGSQAGVFSSWSKRVRQPFINVCGNYKGGWSTNIGGDTTYCTLTANQAVFRTFKGNPVRRYYLNSANWDNNVVTYEYDPNPITGLRYYILGIPA